MKLAAKFPKLNLSVQLLIILGVALFFSQHLPETLKAILYAISLTLKNFLLFMLPIVIFSCLFSCLLTFRGRKAVGFMLGLFLIVCLSNYLSTLIAYTVGLLKIAKVENFTNDNLQSIKELLPYWNLQFPQWLSNDQALYLGFCTGAFFSFFPTAQAYQLSLRLKQFVNFFLNKVFLPLLPLFALGFILKIQHEGLLVQIIQTYFLLMAIILLTYLIYLIFLFGLAANFKPTRWLYYFKNIIPVALTGFATMSSLATMPITLAAAEKNTGDPDLARAIIPATVNVHMIGASIGIPLMAFSILLSFGYEFPSFTHYCQFALYFIMAQFAVAGVPGGAILVMLPLLEKYLHFTSEMSALITALYILFDPMVTITNVLGNSALVILIAKIFKPLTTKLSSTSTPLSDN